MIRKNSQNPSLESSQALAEFLQIKLEESGLSLRKLAAEIGISFAQYSHMMRNERSPTAGICNRIADYFQVPRTYVYGLAGWLDYDPVARETDLATLREFCEDTEQYQQLQGIYDSIGDIQEKQAFLTVVRKVMR